MNELIIKNNRELNFFELIYHIVKETIDFAFYNIKTKLYGVKNTLVDITYKQQFLENELFKLCYTLLKEIKKRDNTIKKLKYQLNNKIEDKQK